MEKTIFALGDSAWMIQWPPSDLIGAHLAEIHGLMSMLEADPRRPDGVGPFVAAYETLAIRYDPMAADGMQVRKWIESWCAKSTFQQGAEGRLHEIPVCYGGDSGPDLCRIADACGLTEEEVVARHSGAEYTVAMMGFAPGFPYLIGLDSQLQVPRLATPRNRVPAGSVAIAGEQAGIYPCDSPGGWHVLGRTSYHGFDPHRSPLPSLLQPGDRVRFIPADRLDKIEVQKPSCDVPHPDVEVVEPGFLTSVQSFGRPDFEHFGVSPGGVMDPEALRAANLLLGNPEHAAALEIQVRGPSLRFLKPARVVLVGADGSNRLRHGRAVEIPAGSVLDGAVLLGSSRAVLAFGGGIEVPRLLGSMATDLRAGFGGHAGRTLQVGDLIALGQATCHPPRVDSIHLARPTGPTLSIRYVDGPQADWFTSDALAKFQTTPYEVTTRQNRMGMRLHGESLPLIKHREMRSQPVATGSIQIPSDGRPVILLAERQTHGGYPQIGCVITADLPKLARALPGTRVHFIKVSLAAAWRANRDFQRDFQLLRAGLMCAMHEAPGNPR